MSAATTGLDVVGRDTELVAVAGFFERPPPHALVIEGEAGIGKTTIWFAAVERARAEGQQVLLAGPAFVEKSLSFAGLRDLLRGVPPAAREQLPQIQRQALAAALAEEDADAPVESGVLSIAVLNLLKALAAARPLLVAIDDLQWLDDATAAVGLYAIRRLAESDTQVRLLASCRGRPGAPLPFGLDQALRPQSLVRIGLEGLSEGALRRLLLARLGLSLPRREFEALYRASRGNPFFALEIARAGVGADAAGLIRLPRNLQELLAPRLRALDPQTREALLLLTALGDRRPQVLHRLGIEQAVEAALAAGELEHWEGRLFFSHALVPAALWAATDERRRRQVHRRLAEVVDDVEERAWHLAATTQGPDGEAARALEEAAEHALRRGTPAAASDLLERALRLLPADAVDHRARLMAHAAAAHAAAGHWNEVWDLVREAQEQLPAGPERARILVAAAELRPGLDGLLRQAAAEAGETATGVRARLGLIEQASFAGRWRDAVEAAETAAELSREAGDKPLLGVALTYLGVAKILDSQADGMRDFEEALLIEQEVGVLPTTTFMSPRALRATALVWSGDPDAARGHYEERLRAAAERGDDMSVFQLRQLLLLLELRAGELAAARRIGEAALEQVELLGYEYGRPILDSALAMLEASEGNLDRARTLGREAVAKLTAVGDRLWSTHGLAALLFTELSAGDGPAALTHAEAINANFPDGSECWWSYHQGDELEALVLGGQQERALSRAEALRAAGKKLGLARFLAWADRGEGLRCEALGDLARAESALAAALVQHERFTAPFERARTLLAYGRVLRRLKRRRDARSVLGEALADFERLGARGFAAETRSELGHVSGRTATGDGRLTPTEQEIAGLVARGLPNKEVAAELVLAVSTVEASLTRIYRKLGVRSRSQLAAIHGDGSRKP